VVLFVQVDAISSAAPDAISSAAPGPISSAALDPISLAALSQPGGPLQDCIWPVACWGGRLTPLGPTVPWPEVATNGNLWWGDYEDGVVAFGDKFYGIWGDNRDGSTETKLYGAWFDE
jgi:hypothetical protein